MKEDNQYYVYAHINPKTGDTFYVGKGIGDRAYSTRRKNEKWKKKVKELNGKFDVEFIQKNLTEMEAFELEFITIKQIGKENDGGTLVNTIDGGGSFSVAIGPFPTSQNPVFQDNYSNPFDDESQWERDEEKTLYRYINSLKKLDSVESEKMTQEIRSKLNELQDIYYKICWKYDDIKISNSDIGAYIETAIGYDIEDDEIWTTFLNDYLNGKSDYRVLVKDLIDIQSDLEFEIEEDDTFEEDEEEYQELRNLAKEIITFYQSIINKYFPREQ